jgi:hypothetical protein
VYEFRKKKKKRVSMRKLSRSSKPGSLRSDPHESALRMVEQREAEKYA